ncbi:hypothetical protein NDU88_006009 [Pleurodeles waltl]|uniref:Uncharacterized protein n=1 Tax=Pleurodeles waltl TaxID=8319 RepID=A0AAV7WYR0_PLEWA|nr:hypothetical protein NDU88_006009 [Pleurodeles waltl]
MSKVGGCLIPLREPPKRHTAGGEPVASGSHLYPDKLHPDRAERFCRAAAYDCRTCAALHCQASVRCLIFLQSACLPPSFAVLREAEVLWSSWGLGSAAGVPRECRSSAAMIFSRQACGRHGGAEDHLQMIRVRQRFRIKLQCFRCTKPN